MTSPIKKYEDTPSTQFESNYNTPITRNESSDDEADKFNFKSVFTSKKGKKTGNGGTVKTDRRNMTQQEEKAER